MHGFTLATVGVTDRKVWENQSSNRISHGHTYMGWKIPTIVVDGFIG